MGEGESSSALYSILAFHPYLLQNRLLQVLPSRLPAFAAQPYVGK